MLLQLKTLHVRHRSCRLQWNVLFTHFNSAACCLTNSLTVYGNFISYKMNVGLENNARLHRRTGVGMNISRLWQQNFRESVALWGLNLREHCWTVSTSTLPVSISWCVHVSFILCCLRNFLARKTCCSLELLVFRFNFIWRLLTNKCS